MYMSAYRASLGSLSALVKTIADIYETTYSFRTCVEYSSISHAFADHRMHESLKRYSARDRVRARLVSLSGGEPVGPFRCVISTRHGRAPGLGRRQWIGQNYAGEAVIALLRSNRGADPDQRGGPVGG